MDKKIAEIIRVNHAGEYGAKRIYEGQIAFTKNLKTKNTIKEMYVHELEHLEYFDEEMKKRHVRPTLFSPLWHVAAYTLGGVTALMGEKAAMICTYAVESVIENHYQEQLDELKQHHKDEKNLTEKIEKFRSEEIHHKNIADDFDIVNNPLFPILNKAIGTSSKIAIWLSKRF